MKLLPLLTGLILVIASIPAVAQEKANSSVSSELKKMEFLLGNWETVTYIYETGFGMMGNAVYREYSKGNYIIGELTASRPEDSERDVCMIISYDTKTNKYRVWIFAEPPEPAVYSGTWIGKNTMSFTIEATEELDSRKRFHLIRKPDRTILQIYEVFKDGAWQPMGETRYRPRSK